MTIPLQFEGERERERERERVSKCLVRARTIFEEANMINGFSLPPGVHFTNVFTRSFMPADPKAQKAT